MSLALKTISKYVIIGTLLLVFVASLGALFGLEANAQNTDAARQGLGLTGEESAANAEDSLGTIIETIINVLSIVVGAVSVIMIIIGGLKYVTSAGDSAGVQGAKNTILYAIVGLVIVIFAQTIVLFVIDRIDSPPASETTETDEPESPDGS